MKTFLATILTLLTFLTPTFPTQAEEAVKAEETAKRTWTSNLRAGPAKQLNRTIKDKDAKSKNRNQGRNNREATTKIIRQMVLPVTVTCMGKDLPTTGLSLRTVFIGKHDETTALLGDTTIEVKLNEKGTFKTEIKSSEATFVKTMRTQGRRTTTTTSGDVLTGCLVQLKYEGKVLKSWGSRSDFAKIAKQETLDTEALLKTR